MAIQTVQEAVEMIRRQTGASIRMEDGELRVQVPKAKDNRLRPVLDFLRDHRAEALQLLAEPPAANPPAAYPVPAESTAHLEPTEELVPPETSTTVESASGAPVTPVLGDSQIFRDQQPGETPAPGAERIIPDSPAPGVTKAPKPRFNGPPLRVARRAKGETIVFDGFEWIHAPLGITASTRRQVEDLAARGAEIQVIRWPEGQITFANGRWTNGGGNE